VLGVLNAELPGTSVAFSDRYGTHVAGRRGPEEGAGHALAEVEVLDREGGLLGRLRATGAARSAGWPSVVRTVLGLAVAPLAAWAATERLAASRDFELQAAVADRLLAGRGAVVPPGESEHEADPLARSRETGVALGWPVEGTLTGFLVRPSGWVAEPGDAPRAQAVITAVVGAVPVIRRGEGWGGWSALQAGELAERLERCVETLPWPCSGGVGTTVAGLEAVEESLLGAEAAAFVAGRSAVSRADRMGPAELLGALPAGVLLTPATVILEPIMSMDKDGTLLETLAAVLDEGGALKAAERLHVHRNTVSTRLDRIRAAGYDLDDASTRLALQLACHVVMR
jgi:hypothetical protein